VKSNHGVNGACTASSTFDYLDEVMAKNRAYYVQNSWGQLELESTVTPMLSIAYSGDTCGNHEPLMYYAGGDATALDMMAFAAAETAGYPRSDYNFNVRNSSMRIYAQYHLLPHACFAP